MAKYTKVIPPDMRSIIDNCAIGLGAVGIGGGLIGPGADLLVIGPVWIGMTMRLAEKAGQKMSEQTAKKIALAVCTGAGTFIGGAKVASTVIAWLTAPFTLGASLLISAGANAALNVTFTKSYGNAVARYFLQTTQISSTEVMVQVLIALVCSSFGISTPYDYLIA